MEEVYCTGPRAGVARGDQHCIFEPHALQVAKSARAFLPADRSLLRSGPFLVELPSAGARGALASAR